MSERLLQRFDRDQNSLVRMANPEKISPVSGDKDVSAAGTAERLLPISISAIVQGTKTITIAGDYSSYMGEGDTIDIEDSTGNDGDYTVVTATENAGNTDIVTEEALPSAVADGNLIMDIPVRKIRVQAKNGNSDSVWVGGSNIAADKGEELTPGETLTISADIVSKLDLNEHYIDVDTNGDGVTFNFYRILE